MTIKKIYIYIIYIEPLRTGTAFPGKLLSGKNRAVRISLCLEVDLSAIAAFWIVHSPGLPRNPQESPWPHGPRLLFSVLRVGLEPDDLDAAFGRHFAHGAGLLLVDAEDPYRIYRQ